MFGWLKRKSKYVFTDEDRELSRQKRQLQMQYDLMELEEAKAEHDLKMQQITAELHELTQGDNDGDFLTQIMTALAAVRGQSPAGVLQTPIPTQTTTANDGNPAGVQFSDEQLSILLQAAPPVARLMPDDTLSKTIREKLPGLNEATIQRAIYLLKAS